MMSKHYLLALVLLTAHPLLYADEFQRCLLNLEQTALQSGISRKTIDTGLKPAQFLPEVIKLDRYQPEFNRTFAHYLNLAVSNSRVEQGKILLKQYAGLLEKLRAQYGIPPHTLIAFWGLESNFGRNLGDYKIMDSLPTLACDPRRSHFFTTELMAALQLMDTFGFTRDALTGSWAGAIGHTQFMPSNYLRYAVSYNKHSIPNLLHNIPDALTSAANYLNQLGWQQGWKWGREVYIPDQFDYRQSGLKNSKPLDEWQQLGIRTIFHDKVPEHNISASLLIPGGHENAAFLVYDNFQVIMKWNRSILYAIAVGYLADRLNGYRPLQKPLKDEGRLAKTHIQALQIKLTDLGFTTGKADGLMGPATNQAISAFQHSKNMIADGYPSESVFKSLGIKRNL